MTSKKENNPSRVRTMVKSVTFRISATVTTFLLVFFTTGEVALAFQIGLIEFIAKLFLYYSHERAWNFVGWGKNTVSAK